MKDFTLLGTRVLVKQREIKKQSGGGIILPAAGQAKPLEGIVVAVGESIKTQEEFHLIRTGNRVLFDPFAGIEITIYEEPYLIMDIEDIVLIFDKE